MSFSIYSRVGREYLGNNNPSGDREVHRIRNEKPQCQINEIISHGHAVGFYPDTLEQAHLEGFDNCAYCIGRSTR
jgi:hypothetical protein